MTNLLDRVEIIALAFIRCLPTGADPARHPATVKSQFAGKLITSHTLAPHRKAARSQHPPGHSHPAANRAELIVFLLTEKAALIFRIKKLTDDARLTAQREEN